MARRARSIVRTSRHCDTAKSHTTVAASAQSPSASAPLTATSISTWMSSVRRRSDASALAAGSRAESSTARANAGHASRRSGASHCRPMPAATSAPAAASGPAPPPDETGAIGRSCSSHAFMPVSPTASAMAPVVTMAAS